MDSIKTNKEISEQIDFEIEALFALIHNAILLNRVSNSEMKEKLNIITNKVYRMKLELENQTQTVDKALELM